MVTWRQSRADHFVRITAGGEFKTCLVILSDDSLFRARAGGNASAGSRSTPRGRAGAACGAHREDHRRRKTAAARRRRGCGLGRYTQGQLRTLADISGNDRGASASLVSIALPAKAVDIAAAPSASSALLDDGSVMAWGARDAGRPGRRTGTGSIPDPLPSRSRTSVRCSPQGTTVSPSALTEHSGHGAAAARRVPGCRTTNLRVPAGAAQAYSSSA